MIPARRLWSIDSCPSVGPTLRISKTSKGTGKAPERNRSATSPASSRVKRPEMMPFPSVMTDSTTGATTTSPSKTIGNGMFVPTQSRVSCAKTWVPWASNSISMAQAPN